MPEASPISATQTSAMILRLTTLFNICWSTIILVSSDICNILCNLYLRLLRSTAAFNDDDDNNNIQQSLLQTTNNGKQENDRVVLLSPITTTCIIWIINHYDHEQSALKYATLDLLNCHHWLINYGVFFWYIIILIASSSKSSVYFSWILHYFLLSHRSVVVGTTTGFAIFRCDPFEPVIIDNSRPAKIMQPFFSSNIVWISVSPSFIIDISSLRLRTLVTATAMHVLWPSSR